MKTTTDTVHGGLDVQELKAMGIEPEGVLDFSANIGPLGPPEGARAAIASADLAAYPDRQCVALREALAERLEVGIDAILVGNGSTELIHLLARSYLQPGDAAVVFGPTFGEYHAACQRAGACVHEVRAEESDGFQWELEAAAHTIRKVAPRLVFLCNPNNPTGVYLSEKSVDQLAAAIPAGGLLVLDEAYKSLSEVLYADGFPRRNANNVVTLRSMTKDYALAGIRLGYMVAPPGITARARREQPTWSVNTLAQAAGLAALRDVEYLERNRAETKRAKAFLQQELARLGLNVLPSVTNFLLVRTGDATATRTALLKQGVCVRDCTSFGLPEYVRIGLRTAKECERLVAAFRRVVCDV